MNIDIERAGDRPLTKKGQFRSGADVEYLLRGSRKSRRRTCVEMLV